MKFKYNGIEYGDGWWLICNDVMKSGHGRSVFLVNAEPVEVPCNFGDDCSSVWSVGDLAFSPAIVKVETGRKRGIPANGLPAKGSWCLKLS